jgi:hypothetical protein
MQTNKSFRQDPQRVTLLVYNVLRCELQAGAFVLSEMLLLLLLLDSRVLKDLDERR